MNALVESIQIIDNLEKRIKELEKENAELKKQVRSDSWRYEYEHRDDWRKPVEMGQL